MPGLDGTYMPFGDARIASVDIDDNWENTEDNDDDWALIYLDRDIGAITGTFGVSTPPDWDLDGAQLSIYGYPGTNGQVTLNAASGVVTCTDAWSIFSNTGVVKGFSGSGVTFAAERSAGHGGSTNGAPGPLPRTPFRKQLPQIEVPPTVPLPAANVPPPARTTLMRRLASVGRWRAPPPA